MNEDPIQSPIIKDPNVLQQRASNPEKSVWVSASAGSGKTKVLTDRVLSLLLADDDPHPERILCITFTKAAAAEMDNRLNSKLGPWSTMDEPSLIEELEKLLDHAVDDVLISRARRLFAKVLDTPGGFKIQTVHSFCQSLLGRFPLEANLPPHFEVMDERTAAEMMQRARDVVLRTSGREGGRLAAALEVITRRANEEQFAELMRSLSSERGRLRRFRDKVRKPNNNGPDAMIDAVYGCLNATKGLSEADIIKAACDEAFLDAPLLRKAASILQTGTAKTDVPAGEKLAHWLALNQKDRFTEFDDYRLVFLTGDLSPRVKVMTNDLTKAHPEIANAMYQKQERLMEAQEKISAQVTAQATEAMLVLGEAMLKAYELEKKARAQLDYDDLILKARDLIMGEKTPVSWVLYKLDGGLDHILIDEAQDTSPEQWDVISALADEFFTGDGAHDDQKKGKRTIFAVGDVKQSIYSFQRADPKNFEEKQGYFATRALNAKRGWDTVPMDVSFRSTAAVLKAVDHVFESDDAKDGLVGKHNEVKHYAHRSGHAGHVELWPLVEAEKSSDPLLWELPNKYQSQATPEQRLAKIMAKKIASWVNCEELPSRGRKIKAGDILILVRRRKKLVGPLVRALKALDIPVAGVDRMVLNQQIAVQDLVQLGHFLSLPEDDLALATILKSPFFGLDDDDLFKLAYGRNVSLWRCLQEMAEQDDRYATAVAWLQRRLNRVDYARPFELFAEILTEICPVTDAQGAPLSGRQAIVARLGAEADDPIDEFLNLALSFEQTHIPSLQAFLHWFDVESMEIKRDLESVVKDEVRIMTVHGAKGLQAPIVLLPDTVGKPGEGGKKVDVQWVKHKDEDKILPIWTPKISYLGIVGKKAKLASKNAQEQEYRRLLYVAMTRAEDRLYVCGCKGVKKPMDGNWYDMVKQGLKNIADTKDMDFTIYGGDGRAGEGLVLSDAQTVAPVVDKNLDETSNEISDLPAWLTSKPSVELGPPKPLIPSKPLNEDPPVHSPLTKGGSHLFKRGTITHKLLQSLPDIKNNLRYESAKRYLSMQIHGLTPQQQNDILTETMAVLNHPEFKLLFGLNSQAEVPVVGLVRGESPNEAPRAISGKIDRLLITDKEIFIIDYKTLRPSPKAVDAVPVAYLRQLASYKQLLENIYPNHKVRTALLWTEEARLMEISKDLLDPY